MKQKSTKAKPTQITRRTILKLGLKTSIKLHLRLNRSLKGKWLRIKTLDNLPMEKSQIKLLHLTRISKRMKMMALVTLTLEMIIKTNQINKVNRTLTGSASLMRYQNKHTSQIMTNLEISAIRMKSSVSSTIIQLLANLTKNLQSHKTQFYSNETNQS